MTFESILFRDVTRGAAGNEGVAPDYFADLNLDQIVASITAGRDEYDLKPFFYSPLSDSNEIALRHEVFRDLEEVGLFESVKAFATCMRTVRERLTQAKEIRHELQKQRWFFDAVRGYCEAVIRLAEDLAAADLRSRGFSSLREYLTSYTTSAPFTSLWRETRELAAQHSEITYGILVQGARVDVRFYEGEPDYSAEVLSTFDRFKQGGVQKNRFEFSEAADVNHIEGPILDRVALLHREAFDRLARYRDTYRDFQDLVIARFDREIEFYLAYHEYIGRFKKLGLHFCHPAIATMRSEIFDYGGFDLALAGGLLEQNATPVCNDFHLRGPERVIVVSGPNQGGKTTFARTFGQLHHLASLGCPVPGTSARLYLFDRMFSHFERGENIAHLHGKLQDDLLRVHRILDAATPRSIIIMNEIFASTTLRDAIALSRKIAATLMRLDLYCIWVTFIDELASLSEKTVSMVSTVSPQNPALRTYKILRQPADGLAYALSIAEKYRLTYGKVKERIPS